MSEPTTWARAQMYYEQRGLPWTSWTPWPKGDKFEEEARELKDALTAYYALPNEDTAEAVREEIADVAITLAWIARCYGTTIEECMDNKTLKDAGRGFGPSYLAGT